MPLPVLATVSRAYSFVFTHFGVIYRLCWFPVVLASLPSLLRLAAPSGAKKIASLSIVQMAIGIVIGTTALLASLYFISMALAAVHRLILFNDQQPGKNFIFSAGPVEFLFSIVPIAGFLLVGGIVFGMDATGLLRTGHGRSAFVPFLLISAIACIGYWAICRLVPLYPLIVMTERLALREAWQLSRGAFWRIAGVLILASLPMTLASAVLSGITASITNVPPNMAGAPAALVFSTAAGLAIEIAVNIPMMAVWVAVLCYTTKALAELAPDDVVRSPDGSS